MNVAYLHKISLINALDISQAFSRNPRLGTAVTMPTHVSTLMMRRSTASRNLSAWNVQAAEPQSGEAVGGGVTRTPYIAYSPSNLL